MVLESYRDDRGTVSRTLTLTSDGGLELSGCDFGSGVERVFGSREYEFRRAMGPEAVQQLRISAELGPGPQLLAIRDRFPISADLEEHLQRNGIEMKFWSRIGD